MARTFAELYAFELHASPKGSGLDPFGLFTTASDNDRDSNSSTPDLPGEGRGDPAPSVFLMLREGRGAAAMTSALRGG